MSVNTLLIIEDEPLLGTELVRFFRSNGWEVDLVRNLSEARGVLVAGKLDPLVVLSDMNLPDGQALDLLEELSEPRTAWVFLTGYGSIPDSLRAVRLGAYDFLEKPVPMDRLDLVVTGALRTVRASRRLLDRSIQDTDLYSPESFLGGSRVTRTLRTLLRRLASVPLSSVVIEGETGAGKGLVARILHHSGVRSRGPLVEINCAALPSELLESELFGHEAGAFSGAQGRHRGLLEQATGGTIFLDEIGQMDAGLQAKLLKAVEDGRVRRVGGEGEVDVDVQIFAASNESLSDLVHDGRFREDLFHRLSVFSVHVRPLRERKEDLDELVPALLAEFNARSGKSVTIVHDAIWERLRAYDWPGNVRELRNVLERSVMLSDTDALPSKWLGIPSGSREELSESGGGGDAILIDSRLTLDEAEEQIIRAALKRNRFNVAATARELGTTRQKLRYRIEKHRIGVDS
jgi:DNA-binding NtrC family response regulator